MAGYDELFCIDCGEQIGWLTDSGPRGIAYCNSCKEAEVRRQEEIDNEDSI